MYYLGIKRQQQNTKEETWKNIRVLFYCVPSDETVFINLKLNFYE